MCLILTRHFNQLLVEQSTSNVPAVTYLDPPVHMQSEFYSAYCIPNSEEKVSTKSGN